MDFSTIPLSLLTPGSYVEFDNSRANSGLVNPRKRALLLGQRLPSGTSPALTLLRIDNPSQATSAFGRGSSLAAMCAAFAAQAPTVELWACALDDLPAGVAAEGTLTVTGTAVSAGVIALYVAGRFLPVGVSGGDSATTIAAALAAAINADLDLPLTAVSAAGEVTLTARHKGEIGNVIDVRVNYQQGQRLPAGVTLAITCPESGSGNPDLNTALPVVGEVQYQTWVTPWLDAANLTVLEQELSRRWGGLTQNDGHAYAGLYCTYGSAQTLAQARNSPHLTLVSTQFSPTLAYEVAARVAARDAAEDDPARPRQTLILNAVLPPGIADRYLRSERDQHLRAGLATLTVDDGGQVRIERLVTTYKTNAQSIDDPSYRDVETLRTLSFIRFQVRARISQVYPRHKLARDGVAYNPSQSVATPLGIRSELIALFQDLVNAALVENLDQFKADLRVEIDSTDPNRVNVLLPPNLVNQFRVFAASVQFRS